MKTGDLVKVKCITRAQIRRNMMSNEPVVNQVGIVIEVAENACKVLFSSLGGNIRTFLKSNLEIIACE